MFYNGELLDIAELQKNVDEDYIYLTWRVTAAQVSKTGTVFACVTGNDTNDTVKWSSFMAPFYTEKSLGEDADTLFHDLAKKINKEIEDRQAADSEEINTREAADALLQQHIDEEATARAAAVSSEASARAASDAGLQSQINQIIAPTGEAPSAAEVQNARIGENGRTYSTLGDAIRTQVRELYSGFETILFHTDGFATAVSDWATSVNAISASTYWGMNKVYSRGPVKYIIQKIAVADSRAEVILYSTDGSMRQLKKISGPSSVPVGFLVYEVNEYISEDFYIFAYGRTAYYDDSAATYKSKMYYESSFTSTKQFILGVVYESGESTSPFIISKPEYRWVNDIQVIDATYKQYKISYLCKESIGYHYYIRLEGSNDGSTWTIVDNIGLIITEGETWTHPSAEILKSETGKFTVVVNWDLSPSSYTNLNAGLIKPTKCIGVEQYYAGLGASTAGYAIKDETKHYVVVDANGTGDFTTISEACDYVRGQNPTVSNQFEIVVKPGRYSALAVIVPPFTHIHGQFINSVVITSEDYAGESTQPPLRQDFGSSKLSNLHIISGTGYCIHYDQGLNNCVICNENLILEKTDTGDIIGGGSWLSATFIWKNCTFINGNVPCHTNIPVSGWDNTRVIFDGCKLVNAYFRNGSVGGQGGEYIFEINDSYTKLGSTSLIAWQDDWANTTDPTLYAANTCEWQVVGKGNKNFLPQIGNTGTGLMVETANVNEQLSIGGTAVPVLFGYAKVRKGGPRLKGRVYGIYRVQDKKAGDVRGREGVDVFQMWKRLGDCTENPLTLTVTVGDITQSYTFDNDYETTRPSESTILSAVNSVLTVAKIRAYTPECWENIQTEEKTHVVVSGANGVLAGEYVRHDGTVCMPDDPADVVYGRALEDGANGELVQVWTGNVFKTTLPAGEYGIGPDGSLSINASTKIGYVMANGVFVRSAR